MVELKLGYRYENRNKQRVVFATQLFPYQDKYKQGYRFVDHHHRCYTAEGKVRLDGRESHLDIVRRLS